jgi:hypothetical protein
VTERSLDQFVAAVSQKIAVQRAELAAAYLLARARLASIGVALAIGPHAGPGPETAHLATAGPRPADGVSNDLCRAVQACSPEECGNIRAIQRMEPCNPKLL